MSEPLDYRSLLQSEFDRRKSRQSSYSLRAFSRTLRISPAQLSQLLSGKRPLTAKTAKLIADRLNLSPTERNGFVNSILERVDPGQSPSPEELSEENFQLIASWYHFAILSLADLKSFRPDPFWIAGQLGIEVAQAADALKRLQVLKVIEIKNGRLIKLGQGLRTTSDIPSAAIRRNHYENLTKAQEKLEEIAVELREFSSITTAISTTNIPQAKRLITQFKRELATLLEKGRKEAVYTLAIQLFPVSKMESK